MRSQYVNNGLSDGLGQITAESTPEYDIPLWPFDSAWDCQDWMSWHRRLKEKHGLKKANELFLQAWNKQSFWEFNKSFCKYSDTFFDYFQQQGLDAGNFVSKITRNIKDTAVNVSEGAKSVSGGLDNLSLNKVLLIVGAGTALYFATPFFPVIKRKLKSIAKKSTDES